MSTSTAPAKPGAPQSGSAGSFNTLVTVGVLVVAAGLLLPRMLSLTPIPQDAEPTAPAVVAKPAPPPPTSPSEEPTSLFWVAAKVIFGLAIVAGASIALARWTNQPPAATSLGVLNPVAKLAVDARCVVHLVNAGGRRLLVGTDATGIKATLELPPR